MIDDAEDLDLVMSMYNTDSLWFFSKDEASNFNADIAEGNAFQFFKYKAKLLGDTVCIWSKWDLKKQKNCCPIKVSK